MSDTFVKDYKPVHEVNQKLIREAKEACEAVEKLYKLVDNREMSIARTLLENASMWATKAFCLENDKNGGNPIRS